MSETDDVPDASGPKQDAASAPRLVLRLHAAPRPSGLATLYASIGVCVARRRAARQMSQRELAFSLGLKLAQLQSYESGETVFTPDLLLRAAKVLNVRMSDFFVGLAEQRLEELRPSEAGAFSGLTVAESAADVRAALADTISRCNGLLTILDIIDASRTM